ncbi:hypothetical protein ABZ646_34800 [Streptomyces sp. NPDC007162]|uniref:hypothetical protein n=1 Tax=Streptomyces sp. NPDC007162 TaxID=3156917 RepID=UPI0033C8855F
MSTALALAVMGTAGAADARVGADWVGYGCPNHYNAVRCTQEGINNSPTPHHVKVDGIVGPETGDDLLGWLGSGCDSYLPTTG